MRKIFSVNSVCSESDDIPKLTWREIINKYKSSHANICAVLDLLQTLPASSAEVERGFSKLKLVKTDVRSRLVETSLNDLLSIKLLSPPVNEFDPTPAVILWNTKSDRPRRPMLMDKPCSEGATGDLQCVFEDVSDEETESEVSEDEDMDI